MSRVTCHVSRVTCDVSPVVGGGVAHGQEGEEGVEGWLVAAPVHAVYDDAATQDLVSG